MRSAPPSLPVGRARATLLWERTYAALWAPAALLMILSAAALFGLHEWAPGWLHALGLAAGVGAVGWLAARGLRGFAWPSRDEALARIETDSRVRPGSFRALEDTPFAGERDDPFWLAHLARLREQARRARLLGARSDVDGADRFGLRFGSLVLLAAALLFAGERAGGRLVDAFTPTLWTPAPVVADVWLDPPAYTGRAPVLLVRSAAVPDGQQEQVDVPEGSTLRVRLAGANGAAPRGRLSIVTPEGRERVGLARSDGAATAEATLGTNAAIVLSAAGARAVWPVGVAADRAPTVSLTGEPTVEGASGLVVPVETADDYGIAAASLVMRLLPEQGLPADLGRPEAAALSRSSVVPLPGATGVPGRVDASVDLAEHPWAGLNVAVTVRVTDGKGQEGFSKPVGVRLPSPRFYDPLARTVIEQRRHLAVAPSSWTRTARMLDALTFAPDRFAEGTREYLLLRTAYHDVMEDHGEDVAAVAATLLPLAKALEDEGLQLARQRLEAARDALREALENGATEEELSALIDELRDAMNDYVAALAQSGDAFAEGDAQELGDSTLDDMLDAMRDAAERGAAQEARDLLSQLDQMLQNLAISPSSGGQEGQGQAGRSDGQGQGGGSGGERGEGEGGALGQANEMIDQQRGLADETFSARRGERGAAGLADRQRDLAERLDQLSEEGGGEAGGAFDTARRAMEGAARALEQGELGAAQALQENAIDGLAEGAERLAEARREEGSPGEGTGREGEARAGRQRNGVGRDPLGRPYGRQGDTGVEIPDMNDPARVREVIETLRRRVADPTLSPEERAYLERLLERF